MDMLMLSSSSSNMIQFNIDWIEFRVDFSDKLINDLDNGFVRLNSSSELVVDPLFGGSELMDKMIEKSVDTISPNFKYKISELIEVNVMDKKQIPNVGLVHKMILKIKNKNLYEVHKFDEAVSLVRNIICEYTLSRPELYKVDFNVDFNGFDRSSLDDNKFRLGRYIESDKKLGFIVNGGTLYVNKKSYKWSHPAVSRLYNKSVELKEKSSKLYQVSNFINKEDIFRLELIIDRKFGLLEDKILLNVLGEFLLNGSIEDFNNNRSELICWIITSWENRYKVNDIRGRIIFGFKSISELVQSEEVHSSKWLEDFIEKYKKWHGEDYVKIINKRPIKVDLDIRIEDYKSWLSNYSETFNEDIIKWMFSEEVYINKLWIELGEKFNINEVNIIDLNNKRLKLDFKSRMIHSLICNRFIKQNEVESEVKTDLFMDEDLDFSFGSGEVVVRNRPVIKVEDVNKIKLDEDLDGFF